VRGGIVRDWVQLYCRCSHERITTVVETELASYGGLVMLAW